jgi:hypothetical protein
VLLIIAALVGWGTYALWNRWRGEPGVKQAAARSVPPSETPLAYAKAEIPRVLDQIYKALDDGNPQSVAALVTPEILQNSQRIDAICKPFTYRAHYVEAIIERPGQAFEARVRVLFKPLSEQAHALTFRLQAGRFFLAEGPHPSSGWLDPERGMAAQMSRNFCYAARAKRFDIISRLVSPELAPHSSMTADARSDCFRSIYGAEDTYVVKDTPLINLYGLKVLARVGNASSIDEWKFLFDYVGTEYKIVSWECANTHAQDPNLEAWTLQRFKLNRASTE